MVLSTTPARSADAASAAPPSIITLTTPSFASLRSKGNQAMRRRRFYLQAAVEHDAQRVAPAGDPAGKLRIVGLDRADADDHRIHFVAQPMGRLSRCCAADPARIAARRGDLAVEGNSELENHE